MGEDRVPLEVDPQEVVGALRAGRPMVLIDCREPWEHEIVHLQNAVLIPLGELTARAAEVSATGPVVVYCHHGLRSRSGALMLRRAGFASARSLAGGIDAWASLVDPSLPRY